MDASKNYYTILGVNTEARAEDIKRAYRDKCFILHPDRLGGAPETAKKSAEEELVKVNEAYAILHDLRKRKEYDKKLKAREDKIAAQKNKPKPIVNPTIIKFKDMRPGETRSDSFVINNSGGQYSRIWFSNPDTWVRVTEWHSMSTVDELPLQVNIEVAGQDKSKKYSEVIKVKLDDEEADVSISLTMQKNHINIAEKLFKKKLNPPFTLKDHEWHYIEYKHLTDWMKNRIDEVNAGEELVGKTFAYRRGNGKLIFCIRLKDGLEQGLYTKVKKLVPPATLSDHDWHDVDYRYLTKWVKNRKNRIEKGEKLVGKYFAYRVDKLSGNYQFKLRHNHKKATYGG